MVSRETVHISFTYASLNGLNMLSADVMNAYLTAPTSDNHYILCGPEFGSEPQSRKSIVKRSLYGNKSTGHNFRKHLCDCLEHMVFESCKSNLDMWLRIGIRDK